MVSKDQKIVSLKKRVLPFLNKRDKGLQKGVGYQDNKH